MLSDGPVGTRAIVEKNGQRHSCPSAGPAICNDIPQTSEHHVVCNPCSWKIQFNLTNGHSLATPGMVDNPDLGYYDRYCRRVGDGGPNSGGSQWDGKLIPDGDDPNDPHRWETWRHDAICAPRGFDKPCPEPTPTPSPTPTPPSDKPCPAFKLVRGSLLACQTRDHVTSCAEGTGEGTGRKCDPLPVEGGSCTVDTTQTFEGCPRGCPCDDAHPCDGRTDCFDPRGQEWSWTPGVQCAPDNSPAGDPNRGFQLDCRHLARGTVTWTACVPNNGRTARGEPWVFTQGSQRCATGTFEVK